MRRLDDYAQEINKLTLKINHYEQILMRLYKFLGLNVVFNIFGQQSQFIPNIGQSVYERLRKEFNANETSPYFAKCDVNILEESYGEVCIFSEEREITEFDSLVLDRTVIALSQFLLRSLYTEEKQNLESRTFLHSWLDGSVNLMELNSFLNEQNNYKLLNCRYFVLIQKFQRSKQNFDLTYYKLYSRSIFEKNGFAIFLVELPNQLIYIIADLTQQDLKKRIVGCIEKLRVFKRNNYYTQLKMTTAVGQIVNDYQFVSNSFETAKDTLLIRMNSQHLSYFYEDLFIYQIVLQIQKNTSILEMARDFLKPLYDYDLKHKSQLVETLQIYLQCNCMKQETAEKLFIVRQTLYHRLDKIESLLGSDYLLPQKRLALEIMLLTTQYNFQENEIRAI
ncbi:PucR family transcriptional regulator [Lysinibacillus yapensis]|uniref:PucR family transcriptional regulator n=1 Tax=Ureibacillus yapensis TaxID=2304605 RepID=A0A396SAJ0_9BACL|nr:PucR family transcriptional regulator [Lysinibacillus yapensis]